MFEVRTSSPLDDRWEDRDEELKTIAGFKSHESGANWDGKHGYREHCWNVASFSLAQELKAKLETVEGVNATIREKTSYYPQRRFKK